MGAVKYFRKKIALQLWCAMMLPVCAAVLFLWIADLRGLPRSQFLLLSAVVLLGAALLSLWLTRRFVAPIRKITESAHRLIGGDLGARAEIARRSEEVSELADALEELALAMQGVDTLCDEVIANISHELRSPLAVIVAYGEMVRDLTWSDEAARNENLNLIIREAERLNRMVGDILGYSQLQAGRANLNRTVENLYEVVASEVEFERVAAAAYGLRVELETFSEEIPAKIDAARIVQVMRNLLDNAINHTVDGVVEVAIQKAGDRLRVEVRNPGAPIPKEARRTIWDRYQRLQHQGGRHEGTGLGLSIASTILAAHGFEYGVDFEGGKNIFWFAVTNDSERA